MSTSVERIFNVVSCGIGVQSSTVALMADRGEIEPRPDCGIFADTQAEPGAVYRWYDQLCDLVTFPIYRVSSGNLTATIGAKRPSGKFRIIPIPAYVRMPDGRKMGGLLNRSCTRDYKINPIRKKLRELLGLTGRKAPAFPVVSQWIGISLDEAHRMKPSRDSWIENRWPLIEKRMTRSDCLAWLEAHGFPRPPKSSCVFCPFHSDAHWQSLTAEERETANRVDDSLRCHPSGEYRRTGSVYLHRSGRPLREIDFKDKNRSLFEDGFGNECEGMCGV